ncbi:MAG: hypothetical protein CMJ32_11675 [Phycisphaerae bacterium]|nr:hypothetical protein [Phycisphaerae bacterium]
MAEQFRPSRGPRPVTDDRYAMDDRLDTPSSLDVAPVSSESDRRPPGRQLWQVPTILLSGGLIALAFTWEKLPWVQGPGVIMAEQDVVELPLEQAVMEQAGQESLVLEQADPPWMSQLERIRQQLDDGHHAAAHVGLLRLVRNEPEAHGLAPLVRDCFSQRVHHAGTSSSLRGLLHSYSQRPLDPSERAWVLAANCRLACLDDPAAAGDAMLVGMRRLELESLAPGIVCEMYVVLAECSIAAGLVEPAREALRQAESVVGSGSEQDIRCRTLRGDIALAEQRYPDAICEYGQAHQICGSSPLAGRVVEGLARAHGLMHEHDEAIGMIESLCRSVGEPGWPGVQSVAGLIVSQHDAAIGARSLEHAVSLAELGHSLPLAGRARADIILRVATANRLLADVLSGSHPSPEGDVARQVLVEPVSAEANKAYARAGRAYLEYADALDQFSDLPGRSVDAVWMAADSYDLAGHWNEAIASFKRYLSRDGSGGPRRDEARFRLASARYAGLDHTGAASVYASLIHDEPHSPFAAMSHVPLARCLLAEGDFAEAERRLLDVLQGRAGLTPRAAQYKHALAELARLEFDRGQYRDAIERCTEFIDRYADTGGHGECLFVLGESWWGLALEYQAELEVALTDSQEAHWEELRIEAMEQAGYCFDAVAMMPRPAVTSDGLSAEQWDLAWLYRADARFEQGLFAKALELYEAVQIRQHQEGVGLIALIQVVNCHELLGQPQLATSAHARALARLQQLPDEVFQDGAVIFDREAWSRWLQNRPLLAVVQQPVGGGLDE